MISHGSDPGSGFAGTRLTVFNLPSVTSLHVLLRRHSWAYLIRFDADPEHAFREFPIMLICIGNLDLVLIWIGFPRIRNDAANLDLLLWFLLGSGTANSCTLYLYFPYPFVSEFSKIVIKQFPCICIRFIRRINKFLSKKILSCILIQIWIWTSYGNLYPQNCWKL